MWIEAIMTVQVYIIRLKITLWIDWHEPMFKILTFSGWTKINPVPAVTNLSLILDPQLPLQGTLWVSMKHNHILPQLLCSSAHLYPLPKIPYPICVAQSIFQIVLTFFRLLLIKLTETKAHSKGNKQSY